MIFKKPYAFFIKYFRIINFLLVLLLSFLAYKLYLIRDVINNIYRGSITNFSTINSTYIGFKLFLLIFLIFLILGSVVLLLKQKKKPCKDYLFSIIYLLIIFVYLLFISNTFISLEETILEQTSLKLYSDISFLIVLPIFYFIFKFILIVIGFNLIKFNFSKDIIELKQEDHDDEEVEVIFNRNTYKYKRLLRRTIREFKYYFLENKFLISVILGFGLILLLVTIFSMNLFKSNVISINTKFNAAGITYKVVDIYETYYDLNNKLINDDSKFVVVRINVCNNNSETTSIDLNKIRLMYEKEYVYPNNYFNKYFYDLGIPYNNESLKKEELYDYLMIFKVPNSYKSNKYKLKFFDNLTIEKGELTGGYKELRISATNLDRNRIENKKNIKENLIFNEKKYGNSNITILNYDIKNNYIYNKGDKIEVIKDNDINKILLILDYKLSIDKGSILSNYFTNDLEFFDKFVGLAYTYNNKEIIKNNIKALSVIDKKVMLSVPLDVQNASEISLLFNFRGVKNTYKIK